MDSIFVLRKGGIFIYLCKECGNIFEKAVLMTERHDAPFPPYEEWYGCPNPKCCSGAYVEVKDCKACMLTITGEYITTNDGFNYCENCYIKRDIRED